MRIGGAILLIFLSAGMSGCWSFHKKAPKALPPLNPAVLRMPSPATPVDLPPEATTPIRIEPPPHPPEVTIIKPELQPQPEKKAAKAHPKPAVKKPAIALAPGATTVPATTPTETPAPPPQLAELIPDERRQKMQLEIEQSLDRARSTLTVASQRTLTHRQNETAERVRTFIRQAEEAKTRDISTAVQLSRRADLLAQDLATALHN